MYKAISFVLFIITINAFSNSKVEKSIDSLNNLIEIENNDYTKLQLKVEVISFADRLDTKYSNNIDSLIKDAEDLFHKKNFDTIDFYQLFVFKVRKYVYLNELDSAKFLISHLLIDSSKVDRFHTLNLLENLSSIYYFENNYQKLIETYYSMLYNFSVIKNNQSVYNDFAIKTNIAIAYNNLGQHRKSKSILLELYKNGLNDPNLFHHLAYSYVSINEIDSALFFCESYAEQEEVSIYNINFYLFFSDLLNVHFNRYSESEKILKSISSIIQLDNNLKIEHERSLMTSLGNLYLTMKKYDSSEHYLKKSISICESIGDYSSIEVNHEILIRLYATQNNGDSTYYYFEEYQLNKMKLDSINNLRIVEELDIKHKTKRKEQQIKLLEKEKEILTLENYEKALFLSLLFFLFIIILMISYYLIYRQKKINQIAIYKIRDNKILEENLNLKINQQNEKINLYINEIKEKNNLLEQINYAKNIEEQDIEHLKELLFKRTNTEKHWYNIILNFDKMYPNFRNELNNKLINNKSLTQNEIKLSILIKLNFSTKEMSEILFVSESAISKARQRMYKKLTHSKTSLMEII